ncbi:23S rRNA (guanosine(2251)-2'-O)-methyltransferase RlmB [bacterium B17]|nr:23S rRNA (guanosine(2251)-2'-O)-methyltransferase RlmB [bacterium B17]
METIYGRQPVRESLLAGRRKFKSLYIASEKQNEELNEIFSLGKKQGLSVSKTTRRDLDQMLNGANHQSVALNASPYPYAEFADVVNGFAKDPFVLVLDHLQDPQNMGSLLRTAEAAGVDCVIIPKDRSAEVTPATVRASAGAAEHMRVVKVTNLVRTMELLKDKGFWFTGLEAVEGAKLYTESDYSGAVGLVIGSEGKGIGRLVRENCDFLVKLPMKGKVTSLNAANAGAIMMYEIVRHRAET